MLPKRGLNHAFLSTLPREHPFIRDLMGCPRPPVFSLTSDQRFSFSVRLPSSYSFQSSTKLSVLVVIHGTCRETDENLIALESFVEANEVAVLAPLFPCGIIDPDDYDNYKNLLYKGIRFDHLVFDMLEQASRIWAFDTNKFYRAYLLDYVLRFFYLHPERLLGTCIASPGKITYPHLSEPWPRGVSDISTVFSLTAPGPNWDSMSKVPTLLLVGGDDTDSSGIQAGNAARGGATEPGETRVERIGLLRDALREKGIEPAWRVVPGVKHEGSKILVEAAKWFTEVHSRPCKS